MSAIRQKLSKFNLYGFETHFKIQARQKAEKQGETGAFDKGTYKMSRTTLR